MSGKGTVGFEQKRAEEELKKKSAKMKILNEKLNVVGRLTRHDVGNKLIVVKSNIYLLKKKIGNNSKSSDWSIEASMSLANYLIPKLNKSGKENYQIA